MMDHTSHEEQSHEETTTQDHLSTPETPQPSLEVDFVEECYSKIKQELRKLVIGQEEMIDLLVAGLFSDGHILLEGVPGIAKTLTAKLFAKTITVGFSRVQFTPDLMPADVIGTMVFNAQTSEFDFKKGPLFSNVILIDEINRAPAKTQSALFEVMQEKQISVDGHTYQMQEPYLVLATQNPIEQEGTYKLPEAQLDRFQFRVKLAYPSLEEEQQILQRFQHGNHAHKGEEVKAVMEVKDVLKCRDIIGKVSIEASLINYVALLVHSTRNHGDIYLGASPRASLSILHASKAYAAMNGRGFVIPDDIRKMTVPVLNHRIILTPDKEIEGVTTEEVIQEIIQSVEVPR
ncbi:MoxR family ATPase [Algivirga pacifica]